MAKVAPAPEVGNSALTEQILDPAKLPETASLPPIPSAPPRELPKPLADFKEYVDSKWCYYAGPLAQAELVGVQSKIAYQCHMKILVEERSIHWSERPHSWGNETLLGSRTLGE